MPSHQINPFSTVNSRSGLSFLFRPYRNIAKLIGIRKLSDIETSLKRLKRMKNDGRRSMLRRWKNLHGVVSVMNRKFNEKRRTLLKKAAKLKQEINMIQHKHKLQFLKTDESTYTALNEACRHDDLNAIKCFIGAAVHEERTIELLSTPCRYGYTPLHTAVYEDAETIVNYLLDFVPVKYIMAGLKIRNCDYETPLDIALKHWRMNVALVLLCYLQKGMEVGSIHQSDVEEILCCPAGTAAGVIKFWVDIRSNRRRTAVETLFKTFSTSTQRLAQLEQPRDFSIIMHLMTSNRPTSDKESGADDGLAGLVLNGLDQGDKTKLLLSVDSSDNSLLQNAAIREDSLLQQLVHYVSSTSKVVAKTAAVILTSRNKNGSTFFHLAVRHRSAATIQFMLGTLPSYVTQQILQMKDSLGCVLESAVHNERDDDVISVLLKYIKHLDNNNSQSDLDEVLLCRNHLEGTFLHTAAEYGSHRMLKNIKELLSADMQARLLEMKDSHSCTALHRAAENMRDTHAMLELLHMARKCLSMPDFKDLVFSKDKLNRDFLCAIAFSSLLPDLQAEIMKHAIKELPREVAKQLSVQRDWSNTASNAWYGLTRDWFDQAGTYPVDFYPLTTPPKVVILYSTKDRMSSEPPGEERSDAETERQCVEEYCRKRHIPCEVWKDPTEATIFSAIDGAQHDGAISGLMVFVMSHGKKGLIQVAGAKQHNFMKIDEIVCHMCVRIPEEKPKLLIVQACQDKLMLNSNGSQTKDIHRVANKISNSVMINETESPDLSADPIPSGGGQWLRNAEVKLQHKNFLLFMSTVSGRPAYRHVMIPCLIDSLKDLSPSDCITQAFICTQKKVEEKVNDLQLEQIPELRSTLNRKFCIGKEFLHTEEQLSINEKSKAAFS